MRALAAALLLVLGFTGTARAKDAGKVTVAVMDLAARGVDPVAAAALSTEVTNTVAELRVFSVISGEDIKRLLSLEETKAACTGDADAACLAEIGGALGVEYLVYGEVAKLAETYSVSLVLLDSAKAKAVSRANKKVAGTSQLLDETGILARTLMRPLLDAKRGFLVLDVREREAKVIVDGTTRGVTPLPGRLELAMGPHEVRVEKGGFITWARTIDVIPDQVGVEPVTMVPNPAFIADYEAGARRVRTAAWITAGAAAALVATAGTLRLIGDARFDDLVSKRYIEPRGLCAENNPTYNGTDFCPTELGRANGAVDTVEGIERTDTIALAAAITGAVSGVVSAILFATGDPPDRYASFGAGPSVSLSGGF